MSLRDIVEYIPARGAEAALGSLPVDLSRAVGAGLGWAVATLGVRRETVEEQIAAAFPDKSAEWVRATTVASYRHFGREIATIARLARDGGRALLDRIRRDEVLALYRGVTGGERGAIIVTGHLGNWEVAGAFLASIGLDMAAVVKRQRNEAFDRRLLHTRRQLGIEPIYMQDARARVPEALEEGKTVALVADQDAGSRGVFVPFLGRPASTFRGPARLSLAGNVPLFFGAAVRDGDSYRGILEAVERPAAGPGAEEEYTRRWVARLEAHVRNRPDQYFWFHRRWKTRPQGTP
jgi:KDO2-lipid IV(A) lauroyltransferase